MTTILDKIGLTGSIKLKLIVLFLLVSIIPIIVISNLAFEYGSASTEKQVMVHLSSVADFKVNEIEFWLEDMEHDAELIASYSRFINFLIGHEENAENLPELENSAFKLFKTINDTYQFKRIALIDNSGEVLLSTNSEDIGTILTAKYATTPFTTGKLYIQDIFEITEDNFSMIFATPFFSINTETHEREGEVIGILIIEIDMTESLYPMIGDLHEIGETYETILVRKERDEIVYISDLRKTNKSPLYMKTHLNSTTSLCAIQSLTGEKGLMVSQDYMGEEVLSAHRYIDILNWGLISKVDKNEAFAGIVALKYKIFTVSVFLILFVFGMAIWISIGITKPIIYLEEFTKKIAQGDYTEYPKITSKDEIGSLTNSFIQMESDLVRSRRKIEDYSNNLQHEVDKRTSELVESEERFKTMIDQSPLGIALIDSLNGHIHEVNPMFAKIAGRTRKQMAMNDWMSITHPDNVQEDFDNMALLNAGKIDGFQMEKRYIHPDGSIIWINMTIAPLKVEDSTHPRHLCMIEDITERKETEKILEKHALELELNKNRLDALLQLTDMTDSSLEMISSFVLDKATELTKSKFGFIALTNEDESVLTTYAWSEHVMDACGLDAELPIFNVKDGGLWTESLLQRKSIIVNDYDSCELNKNGIPSGHIPLKRLISIPIFEGDSIVAVATMANKDEEYNETDLRQLKLLMEGMWTILKRNQAEEKYRILFNSSSDAIMLEDENGFIDCNPATLDVFGYDDIDDFIGLHPADVSPQFQPDGTDSIIGANNRIKDAFEKGYCNFEWIHTKKDGTDFQTDVILTAFLYGERKIIQATVRDITQRKHAEKSLKMYAEDLKRSNELKSIFADIMRHDLLNPAGVVNGYVEILFDIEDDEKKIDFLQKIDLNNKKLIKLIESTAKFAKLESVEELKFEKGDIATIFKIVKDNFGPQIEKKQMTVEFKAEGTYFANMNPMIEEVFVNLLSNAIKYSPEKSKIIIDIIDSGENWKVTVTDFGEGVLDEHKTMLFDRFQRVNKIAVKGSGLGLAIVKRIIELHGGDVGVEDNPGGVGSVFWVTIRKV